MARLSASLLLILVFVGFACSLPTNSTALWPRPYVITEGSESISIEPSSFTVTTSSSSGILQRAIARYAPGLFFPFTATGPTFFPVIPSLNIEIQDANETLQYGVDETYQLNVTKEGALLSAQTVFGALRGLETFSQMIIWETTTQNYIINFTPINIIDSPRFAWRGLLLDSARHFLPISAIERTLDAMSYNKFNTLHWHLTDAESFPVQTESYPLLWQRGAWALDAVYNATQLAGVVAYALDRGIRVVPEFDMPGHGAGWGKGYPNLTAVCPYYEGNNPDNVAFNPTYEFTYDVIKSVLTEMAAIFTDNNMHLGADEVEYACWQEDEQINAWMKENHVTSYTALEQYFEDIIQPFAADVLKKEVVLWQDPFHDGVVVPQNNIIEIWGNNSVVNITSQGYRTIWAPDWYLDRQVPDPPSTHYAWIDTWMDFYSAEPTRGVPEHDQDLILGGEAAMWGEAVDSCNIDSRVWPRASAVGERLWSQKDINDVYEAQPRLMAFRCRLAQRNIGAGPIAPDYCPLPSGVGNRFA